jgi:hypothetical protein
VPKPIENMTAKLKTSGLAQIVQNVAATEQFLATYSLQAWVEAACVDRGAFLGRVRLALTATQCCGTAGARLRVSGAGIG